MTNESLDPLFHDYFIQMINVLEVLRSSPEEQCDLMGAYNASWEVQRDSIDMVQAVVTSPASCLSRQQVATLVKVQAKVKNLPQEAITPVGYNMTTWDGCVAAFRHPAWADLRTQADLALEELQVEISLHGAHRTID